MIQQFNRFTALKDKGVNFKKVLDIGAYEGQWTYNFKKLFPDADVLMIEANEDKQVYLRGIGPYKIALLSDSEKEVDYFKSQTSISTGNSIYKENTNIPFEPQKRKTQTLQSIVGNETYDLIKMDVQGSELDIMKGSEDVIKKSKYLLLEMQAFEYNKDAPNASEVIAYLHGLNFNLLDIMDTAYIQNFLINIDALFINKS